MTRVSIVAQVETREIGNHKRFVMYQKTFDVDVMKIGVTVSSWTRRHFNLVLKSASRDVLVLAWFRGQLDAPPHTDYSGSLSGVNGRTLRQGGHFEQ